MKWVIDLKYKRFYFITLIVLMIIYLFWIYQFNFCTINTHLGSTLILFIPIALILLMYLLSKKEKTRGKVAFIASILLIVIFIILNFITLAFIFVNEGISYEDNPYRYEHILKIADYNEYTYQFPRELPKELLYADKVKFYYSPQFLQGGFNLELLLGMQSQDINNYIAKYEDNVKEVIEVNSENVDSLYARYGIYTILNVFKEEDYNAFFEDCTIYLLDNKTYKPNDWNHGYVVYMAKNENLEELLLVTKVW